MRGTCHAENIQERRICPGFQADHMMTFHHAMMKMKKFIRQLEGRPLRSPVCAVSPPAQGDRKGRPYGCHMTEFINNANRDVWTTLDVTGI
jgi:hypothetical protein